MKQLLIIAITVISVAITGPALADPTPDVTAEGDGNQVNTELNLEGQSGGSKPPSGPSEPSDTVVQYFPSCGEVTAENPCAPKQCENGEREYVRVESQRGLPEKEGHIDSDLRCGLPDNSAQSLAIAEFYETEVKIPTPLVHPSPDPGTLVNFPNVLATQFTGYEEDTDIQTADVKLKFTPVKYIWNFSDGNSLTTTDPGKPYDPELTDRVNEIQDQYPVTYQFTDTGDHTITLTVIISGEYSVNGGDWEPIGGSIQATSPTISINVAEARGELILPENN